MLTDPELSWLLSQPSWTLEHVPGGRWPGAYFRLPFYWLKVDHEPHWNPSVGRSAASAIRKLLRREGVDIYDKTTH